jgi:hypothetical protein
MRVHDHFPHQHFRIEDLALIWNHSARYSQYRATYGHVVDDRSMWGNLEVKEYVRINDGGQEENGGKRSDDESDKSEPHSR